MVVEWAVYLVDYWVVLLVGSRATNAVVNLVAPLVPSKVAHLVERKA